MPAKRGCSRSRGGCSMGKGAVPHREPQQVLTWPNKLPNLSTPSSSTRTSRPSTLLSLRNLASRAKGSGCAAAS